MLDFPFDRTSCSLGQSSIPTAASFIRPSRPTDTPISFLDAIKSKYATLEDSTENAISISGKAVEEVGFEKVKRQLAALSELKIIILDGLPLKGINSRSMTEAEIMCTGLDDLKTGKKGWFGSLKIEELDLSRTLLETWADVLAIGSLLPKLSTLELSYLLSLIH